MFFCLHNNSAAGRLPLKWWPFMDHIKRLYRQHLLLLLVPILWIQSFSSSHLVSLGHDPCISALGLFIDFSWATFPVVLLALGGCVLYTPNDWHGPRLVNISVRVIYSCITVFARMFRHHLHSFEIFKSCLSSRSRFVRHFLFQRSGSELAPSNPGSADGCLKPYSSSRAAKNWRSSLNLYPRSIRSLSSCTRYERISDTEKPARRWKKALMLYETLSSIGSASLQSRRKKREAWVAHKYGKHCWKHKEFLFLSQSEGQIQNHLIDHILEISIYSLKLIWSLTIALLFPGMTHFVRPTPVSHLLPLQSSLLYFFFLCLLSRRERNYYRPSKEKKPKIPSFTSHNPYCFSSILLPSLTFAVIWSISVYYLYLFILIAFILIISLQLFWSQLSSSALSSSPLSSPLPSSPLGVNISSRTTQVSHAHAI